jgi:hypothetical protein
MFVFGSPEDTARTFVENFSEVGLGFPDCPVDEQTEHDLKRSITVTTMAASMALKAGSAPEVLAVLVEWYEEAFKALAESSESFRSYVASKTFSYPGGRSPSRTAEYRKIAKSFASES